MDTEAESERNILADTATVLLKDAITFFKTLMSDEQLQRMLVKLLRRDVIEQELRQRGIVEPLMTVEELAQVLNLTRPGLWSKLRNNEIDIPYVRIGRGGGYQFDSKDVYEFIRKKKVHPVVRPASLKRVKVRKPKSSEL